MPITDAEPITEAYVDTRYTGGDPCGEYSYVDRTSYHLNIKAPTTECVFTCRISPADGDAKPMWFSIYRDSRGYYTAVKWEPSVGIVDATHIEYHYALHLMALLVNLNGDVIQKVQDPNLRVVISTMSVMQRCLGEYESE